jgi:hypothetical protein
MLGIGTEYRHTYLGTYVYDLFYDNILIIYVY